MNKTEAYEKQTKKLNGPFGDSKLGTRNHLILDSQKKQVHICFSNFRFSVFDGKGNDTLLLLERKDDWKPCYQF